MSDFCSQIIIYLFFRSVDNLLISHCICDLVIGKYRTIFSYYFPIRVYLLLVFSIYIENQKGLAMYNYKFTRHLAFPEIYSSYISLNIMFLLIYICFSELFFPII